MSFVSDVSSFIAGATAPESGEFEYSVLPPFASHAETLIAAVINTANTHRDRDPGSDPVPSRSVRMRLLLTS
jgi:hypothetical protein